MLTVGKLAKKHGLSRSTLLYYDRIGLFCPTGRMEGEYRKYTAADDRRLGAICRYRKAGVSLKEIARILRDPVDSTITSALEARLQQLHEEMSVLREQQAVIGELLGRTELLKGRDSMDKATWVSILSAAGFSEEDMRRWHVQFEQTAPNQHLEFLRRLSIPEAEIQSIRSL